MQKDIAINSYQDFGLLTFPEAATLLRLKESTLRAWRLQKRIPVVKLGRRVFVRRSDLEAMISQNIVPAKLQRDVLAFGK